MSSLTLQCSGSDALHTTPRGRTTHTSLFMSMPSRLMDLRLILLLCLMLVVHPARINVSSLPLHRDSERQTSHDNEHSHLAQVQDDSASNSLSLDHALHSNREREDGPRSKRAVVINPESLPFVQVTYWEDGIIPFTFEGQMRDERILQNRILNAMDTWHRKTCIRFVPKKPSDEFYVKILISQQVCNSEVGRRSLSFYRNHGQEMKLTEACAKSKGRILHELGHVIGFFHEQQRKDRDQYIEVNMANIKPSLQKQFMIRNDSSSLGTKYDLKSIMHYDAKSTAIDPSRPSFTVLDERVNVSEIGQRNVLSRLDKLQAKLLYQCETRDYTKEAILRRNEVIKMSNYIEHGDQLSLQPIFNNSQCQWISCTFQGCSLSTCPGKSIRPKDRQKCPEILYRIHKIAKNSNESSYIAVGDYVSLHKNRSLEAFGCSETPGNCSVSTSNCINQTGDFNSRECCEQIMIVRSVGKQEGEHIQHKDEIWFEFLKTPSLLPDHMSWLVCDSDIDWYSGSSCYRVIERVNNQLAPQLGGSGGNLFDTPPTLFSIYKF